jgi:hypothetical protein
VSIFGSLRTGLDQPISGVVWLGFAGLLVALFNYSVFACGGGYVGMWGLPGNILAVGLAWYGIIRHGVDHPSIRLFLVGAAAVTTVMLLKNGLEIMWFGHNPVLGRLAPRLPLLYGRVLVWAASPVLILSLVLWQRLARRSGAAGDIAARL